VQSHYEPSTPAIPLVDDEETYAWVEFFNSGAVGGELPPLVVVLEQLVLQRVRVIAGWAGSLGESRLTTASVRAYGGRHYSFPPPAARSPVGEGLDILKKAWAGAATNPGDHASTTAKFGSGP
jgi:hypothetical protein